MHTRAFFNNTVLPLLLVVVLVSSLMVNAHQLHTMYQDDVVYIDIPQVAQTTAPPQKAKAVLAVGGEGKILEVSTAGSVAASYAWIVKGTDDYRLIDGGKTLLLVTSGDPVFVYLAVASGDSVDLATIRIDHRKKPPTPDAAPEVKPDTPPAPPPMPDASAPLKARLDALIARVNIPQDDKKLELRDIATAFNAVAEMAKDGTVKTVESTVDITKKLVLRAIRRHPVEWAPVIAELEKYAEQQADSGNLATVKDHSKVWSEIANTLQ